MTRPVAYEGAEPYIFISYAHKDSHRVLPIVSALQERGFRVWYDAGIEAGTEWPEYIAEHLENCAAFLAFLSQSALESPNCRREITFAIDERKEMLNIYLEELRLSAGMRMQLGVLQAIFFYRHSSRESFMEELCRSRILSPCSGTALQQSPSLKSVPMPSVRKPDLKAIGALFRYTKTDDGGIEITELWDAVITDIEIPWGVTSIGAKAFYECHNLTSVTIPDSVTSIGADAFFWCKNLTRITIPDSVTSIGNRAFRECFELTSITIPDSVTSIGAEAFHYCENLTSITIPDSVTSIGECAFSNCKKLTSITIPDSVTSIGEAAFNGCIKLTSITIPDSVTDIGERAFIGCYNLTSVTIPDSVTSIGARAFDSCKKLTSITIPDSVTSMDGGIFCGCKAEEIVVDTNNPYYCSVNGVLYTNYGKTLLAYPGGKRDFSFAVPDGVTSIGAEAFHYCENLTSITIPDSVTSIGECAFSNCKKLTSITIPDSVTDIGERAFIGCYNLTSVTIPDSVTDIGESAFYNCKNLTRITIPDSVTSIGMEAFYRCGKWFKKLTIYGKRGSVAAQYAKKNKIPFRKI